MTHPAFTSDSVAVVTGGASGIGLASAKKFAAMGMRVAIADKSADRLESAAEEIRAAGASDVMTSATDVSDKSQVEALEAAVTARFGGTDILMNNAGLGYDTSCLQGFDAWQGTLGVNFYGVLYGCQAFGPGMIARGRPGAIINTGSKQGITMPPGNPAYNVSKAALKAYTEALAHELRNTPDCQISVHLLIPGFVYSGIADFAEKPAGAWTPEQCAGFFIDGMEKGDFYILCPDNEVARPLDEKRMAWAMGDIIENRPPLSRWHPDYAEAFAAFVEK